MTQTEQEDTAEQSASEESGPKKLEVRKNHYDSLDPRLVLDTVERLQQRIQERFGDRSLAGICARLHQIGASAATTAEEIGRPLVWVRILTAGLVALIVGAILFALLSVKPSASKVLTLAEFVQASEAAMNDIVLIGAAIFFLVTLETRIKRKKALKAVHELRSLIHIIDMHQLTKDPERLQPEHQATESSPGSKLTPFEMNRYLDYCSEMLSLCAKLAALYAQNFADPVLLQAVGEVENLAIGMTGNVWQKISILQSSEPV